MLYFGPVIIIVLYLRFSHTCLPPLSQVFDVEVSNKKIMGKLRRAVSLMRNEENSRAPLSAKLLSFDHNVQRGKKYFIILEHSAPSVKHLKVGGSENRSKNGLFFYECSL